MTVTAKCLVEHKNAETSQTTQYTAPTATRTIIDKMTATNNGASTGELSVNLVPASGTAATANLTVKKALTPGDTWVFPEIVGQVLNPGDALSTLASAGSSITIRVSGREVTA